MVTCTWREHGQRQATRVSQHSPGPTLARHPLAHVDLYARLDLAPSPPPSQADIRTAYRHLILLHHPDRALQGHHGEGNGEARELNEAWEVLGDEQRREAYDQARREHLAASRATSNAYAVSLSLDLFEPHYSPSSPASSPNSADDSDPIYYTHSCRCSSHFLITREQLEDGVEVVGCEGCSERCRVEYEVVEE